MWSSLINLALIAFTVVGVVADNPAERDAAAEADTVKYNTFLEQASPWDAHRHHPVSQSRFQPCPRHREWWYYVFSGSRVS